MGNHCFKCRSCGEQKTHKQASENDIALCKDCYEEREEMYEEADELLERYGLPKPNFLPIVIQ